MYFHENQLTYPHPGNSERDLHYAYTNALAALAADRVWFNSTFHHDAFLAALGRWLSGMPDYTHAEMVDRIRSKSSVHYPPIAAFPQRGQRAPGPMRILWAARWEPDKRPDIFFEALGKLESQGGAFELNCIGGTGGRATPSFFEEAHERFSDRILRWGYCEDRQDYVEALLDSDIAVSSADHEFFGIGMVEAAAAGAYPLVPHKLAYPEVFSHGSPDGNADFFYDDGPDALASRLGELAHRLADGDLWLGDPGQGRRCVSRFSASRAVGELDDAVDFPGVDLPGLPA